MLLLGFLAAATPPPCPIDHAVYRQRDSAITVQFQPVDAGADWPARLAMKLSFGNVRPAQWWLAWHGGSAGGQFLASTGDIAAADWHPPAPDDAAGRPRGDVSLIAADADYTVRREPLAMGVGAPAHLLVPDLRRLAWYGPDDAPRAPESGQFFDLVRCDDPRPATKGDAVAAASMVTGDFDHDGAPDRAFVRSAGGAQEVVVRHRTGETVIFRAQDDTPLRLSRLAPGSYPTACARESGPRRSRCDPRSVTSTGDTLQFGGAETAQAAAIWSGRAFAVAWLSD